METLRYACSQGSPVAFFNLVVSAADGSKKASLKPAFQDFRFTPCVVGERVAKLRAAADALRDRASEQVTRVAGIPEFAPRESADDLSTPATLTVCRVLREVLHRSPDELLEPTLFQLNHVRIKEPQPSENHFESTGTRLFPKIDVLDCTAHLELRMREKVALELSMMDQVEFVNEAKSGGINFPTLCSMRVLVRKDATEGAPEAFMSAIIVEAAEQDLESPKAMPNASMASLMELLKALPPGPDRMIVAPLNRVRKSPHAGLIVEGLDGARHTCGCVLLLVAHIGKSKIDNLPSGHRIASSHCWNVPFETSTMENSGAPEHADTKLEGELASYCTMSTVQCYTLSSREGKKPVYAVVVLANASSGTHGVTYMVDKVRILNTDSVSQVKSLMNTLYHLFLAVGSQHESTALGRRLHTIASQKTRRLSCSPTDVDLV